MVLQTWTNISISNWQFLIPCYHQNSKGHVKHILFNSIMVPPYHLSLVIDEELSLDPPPASSSSSPSPFLSTSSLSSSSTSCYVCFTSSFVEASREACCELLTKYSRPKPGVGINLSITGVEEWIGDGFGPAIWSGVVVLAGAKVLFEASYLDGVEPLAGIVVLVGATIWVGVAIWGSARGLYGAVEAWANFCVVDFILRMRFHYSLSFSGGNILGFPLVGFVFCFLLPPLLVTCCHKI